MMAVIVGAFVVSWAPFAVMFVLFPTSEPSRLYFFEHPDFIDGITWLGNNH